MNFQLITLMGVSVDQEVYELIMPTTEGEIGVFPGHEHLVTVAKAGAIQVRNAKSDPDTSMKIFAISGGVIEITPDSVKVLVDDAINAEDIDENEAQIALERAHELKATATDQVEIENATKLIDRHAVRLKVAGLRRHRRQ